MNEPIGRISTLEEGTAKIQGKYIIKSLSDSWAGLTDWQDDSRECEAIEMPKTPLELFIFVREHQYYEENEEIEL